jgi:predicted ATPase
MNEIDIAAAWLRRRKTNWYVITGGPSSGKTTTVNVLRDRGYKTTIEHARHFIDTQRELGRSVADVRNHQMEFQLGVLEMQLEQEASISPNDVVFLDRAIPDALAYYRYLELPVHPKLTDALEKVSYKKIFILHHLPLVNDYARLEDEPAQLRIHELIVDTYRSLPFPIVFVPVRPAEERVDFILANL